ncbi:hybrid sensor histidine kinase/response regulator [Massilia sp. KIM]|uniref:hybrid sensor histidine kinase/response regulator n=1 Tax=Massilia sp. KIM TaxID=1955422 RepID=UPI00098FF0C2|nr:response regulator [Massilia sp. KIM]OON62114.1 hybrid sensor histidine kinase/response regulator [Massilia sp. KIM]
MIAHTTQILNVDDNDGARYAKTRILQSAGFQVTEAANGTDALDLVKRMVPALVLLDVKLPDINGIEVCRRIKADPETSSVLVLQTSAALTGRADKIRGLEGGADNYLAAPIEADELIANVNALLRMRQTQVDLRDSEERFRQLTDNIDDVFWMFSVPGRELVYVSPAYAAVWGRSAESLRQQPGGWLDAVHPDDRVMMTRRWEALAEEHHYDAEFRILDAAGQTRWVRDRLFPVRATRGEVYRVARVTSDITARKEMEALLRVADSNKNQFLATLAHELRNPLSPIRNAAALLGATGEGAAEHQARAREVITRQVDHLAHLVDDLLDVARISEGKIVLREEEVDLGAVISQAIETAGPLISARGHRLEVVKPDQQVWVRGDSVRLAQSIGNLLHNAAKFTPKHGEILLSVSLAGEERVRISVRDNGIGIAEDNLPRIFGMFAQVAVPPDRAPEGLGIGLSLVSHLIELHGGRLSADSAGIGMGSTFTVELPVLRVTQHSGAQDEDAAVREDGAGMRVLLVDDNIDAMEMMGFLLGEMGYEATTTADASQIETLALRHKPHVIVLDIGLPGVDGYEVARRIKRNPALSRIRLVAHTGYGSPEDRRRAQEAGFDAHLVKPAELQDLEKALRG